MLELLTEINGPKVRINNLFISPNSGRRLQGVSLTSPDRKYSANPDHRPKVWEERITRELVDWTPEIGALGAKASAGMRFLAELDAYRAKHSRIGQELADMLEAAEQAIRNNPRP